MIYDNIKEICKSQGISVAQLEKNAGLPTGSICKWNEHTPLATSLKAVADVLKVKMEKLLI